MRVNVTHNIDDLANDLVSIARQVRPEMRDVVREGITAGNELAKGYARTNSGTHGRHYPNAFSASMHRGLGLFGNTVSGEYGPDVAKKQGNMAFEDGPGPQTRPHNNLRKSADLIGPQLLKEVDERIGRLFW